MVSEKRTGLLSLSFSKREEGKEKHINAKKVQNFCSLPQNIACCIPLSLQPASLRGAEAGSAPQRPNAPQITVCHGWMNGWPRCCCRGNGDGGGCEQWRSGKEAKKVRVHKRRGRRRFFLLSILCGIFPFLRFIYPLMDGQSWHPKIEGVGAKKVGANLATPFSDPENHSINPERI